MTILPPSSRRRFVAQLGRVASLGVLGSLAMTSSAVAEPEGVEARDVDARASGDWDLSWLDRLKGATDRAVVDWHDMPTPPDAPALDYAARFLDGCAAVYGNASAARAVVVIRHMAIPAAVSDAAWKRYDLAGMNKTIDPATKQAAVRNPFWTNPSPDADASPTLQDVMGRGVIVLACNLALTHMADRLARAHGEDPATVRKALVGALVPGAFLVPSGVWGVVRAQNAGCGLLRP